MWDSPIQIIQKDIELSLENEVLTAIHRVGIDVDKEELIKALNYDRNQYTKGYKYGYSDAKNELIRCIDCKFYTPINRETKTGICGLMMHQNFGDDWFCAGAERREGDVE